MRKRCVPILVIIVLFVVQGCGFEKSKNKDSIDETISKNYWAKHVGSRLRIIKDGDLSATISLDSLQNIPNLYALGPVEGLNGEITAYNGIISVATIDNGIPAFSTTSSNNKGIFLAYGSGTHWKKIVLEHQVSGLDEVERFVQDHIKTSGLNEEIPFPFRIEGIASKMKYHIIYKNDTIPHNKKEHQKAKQKFELNNEDIKIVGFWADSIGEGVYTHPGMRTHLHFMDVENHKSGHVDSVVLEKGAVLYLPLAQ
ncbi:MAG: acetolactate decarboxylase [Bacteroidota bacterium]